MMKVAMKLGVTIAMRGYKFVMTSIAYPEQYDVFRGEEQVGYVRLRGGILSCHEKDCTGEIIYKWAFKDYYKGFFENEVERINFLKDIIRELESRNIVTKVIECVNGTITLRGTRRNISEVENWLDILSGKCGVKNNIMIDESGIFSFIYGDKNDGQYQSRGYGKNYYIRHPEPAKCFGLVEVEPYEEGGFVWRNFEDFEVDVDYSLEYDTSEYDISGIIENEIKKLDYKMEIIDKTWNMRKVKDVTAELEFSYYEKLLDTRCVLQTELEKIMQKGGKMHV